MKTIWNILAAVALANLLGLVGVVVWLKSGDRLSGERVQRIRAMLGETVTAERARLEEVKAQEAEKARLAAEEARKAQPPLTAAEMIRAAEESSEAQRQKVERLRREVEDLQRTLARGKAELDEGWTKLEGERKAFEAMRAKIAALEGSEQFEKALKLYESLKPAQAKEMLQELIDQGEVDQAVAYLNAMQTRTASKVMAEFKDAAVAADLLERLRTRGLEARTAPGAGGAPGNPGAKPLSSVDGGNSGQGGAVAAGGG